MQLRDYRKSALLSAQELADAIGVTRYMLYKWERGQAIPRPAHLRQLADVLKIPRTDIVQLFTTQK